MTINADEMKAYRDQGLSFIKRMKATGPDPCFAIKPDSPEWKAWEAYFVRRLGSLPSEMKRCRAGLQPSVTVPAQWPEWFETSTARAA